MKFRYHIIQMFALANYMASAQITEPGELGSFEYSLVPNLGQADLKTYQVTLSAAKPFKRAILGLNISYTNHHFTFYETPTAWNSLSYEQIHTLGARINYGIKLANNWALNAAISPTLSSNFKTGIVEEDFLFNGLFTINKRWRKENSFSSLSVGVGYGTLFGRPRVIPAFAFSKSINTAWRYFLGIPNTGIDYNPNERHTLSLKASVNGLFANNSASISFDGLTDIENTKLVYNAFNFGMEHRYKIQPNLTTVTKVGYLVVNQLEIRNTTDDLIYDFQPGNGVYFTTGLKFNLNLEKNDIN